MAKRRCKFGKIKRGARKGLCRTRPQLTHQGRASALYGLGGPGCVETIKTITARGRVKRGKDGRPITFVTRIGDDCPKSKRTAAHLAPYQFKRRAG